MDKTPDKGIEQPNKSLKDNSIPDDVKKQIVDFGVWYSGMAKEKVVRAYNRYLAEKYIPETEEDYKLAQYESKHELPPSPIETPSKALSDLKAENERLKDNLKAAKLALKEIYTGTDFPLSIAQNALQVLNKESITRDKINNYEYNRFSAKRRT